MADNLESDNFLEVDIIDDANTVRKSHLQFCQSSEACCASWQAAREIGQMDYPERPYISVHIGAKFYPQLL